MLSSNFRNGSPRAPSPALLDRVAVVVHDVQLGPSRQQHTADLHAAIARRRVQCSAGVGAALQGHGARRPRQVPHSGDRAAVGRLVDVVVASAMSRPRAPTRIRCKSNEIIFGKMLCFEERKLLTLSQLLLRHDFMTIQSFHHDLPLLAHVSRHKDSNRPPSVLD